MYALGFYQVTNVDSGNSRITVNSTHYKGAPSGAVTASAYIVKSILSFSSNIDGIRTQNQIGKIEQIGIVGPLNTADPLISGIRAEGGIINLGNGVGVAGFCHALASAGGLLAISDNSFKVAVSSANLGASSEVSGAAYLNYGIFSGNAYYGFRADWGGSAYALSSIATGNYYNYAALRNGALQIGNAISNGGYYGMYAGSGGQIAAFGSSSSANDVNYSPTINTLGNLGAAISM